MGGVSTWNDKASSSLEARMAAEVKLTEDEAEQYDRQIRLWGLEAQKRYVAGSLHDQTLTVSWYDCTTVGCVQPVWW